ncbi:MAG: hypothetical protein SFY32_08095 [Bacteroidota bacterium]|nr:hypothetical protein [Bacteroidota bacterium]
MNISTNNMDKLKMHNALSWLWVLILACILQFATTISTFAQKSQGIGTDTPNKRAILDISVPNPTTDPQGVLLPRLTTAQRNALGATLGVSDNGMGVYDTDLKSFYIWNGSGSWDKAGTLSTSIVGLGGLVISQSGAAFTIDGASLQSPWLKNGQSIYYNTSFVGIGTPTPSHKLTLEGNATEQPIVKLRRTVGNASVVTMYEPETVAAASPIWISGIVQNTYGYQISSMTTGAATPRLFIDQTGLLGIGTTTPGANLDLVGTARLRTYSVTGSLLTVDGSGNLGMGSLSSIKDNRWEDFNPSRFYTMSFVGVGTTVPNYPFHLLAASADDKAIYVVKDVSGASNTQSAFSAIFSGVPSGGMKIGYESYVTPTAGEAVRGMSSTILNNTSGNIMTAAYSYITNNTAGQSRAFEASNDGSGSGNHIGMLISDQSTGTGERYGLFSNLTGVGGGTNYAVYGRAVGSTLGNYAGYFDDGAVYIKSFTGINVPNPTTYLDVNGSIRLRTYNTPGAFLTVDGVGNVGMGIIASTPNYWTVSGNNIGPQNTDQSINIGSFSGSYLIQNVKAVSMTSNGDIFLGNTGNPSSTGFNNILIGNGNSNISTSNSIIAIGPGAGQAANGTHNSIYIGNNAGNVNPTTGNVMIGREAGLVSTGQGNVVLGAQAGINMTSGYDNVLIGGGAGSGISGGGINIAIGQLSGLNIGGGTNNITIGRLSGLSTVGLTNAIAIGYLTSVSGSNSVSIGNNITSLGINTSAPTTMLDVNGGARIRSLSVAGSVLTVDGLGNIGLGAAGASQWSNNGNSIFYNTSFVGIGTTIPGAKLDVFSNTSNQTGIQSIAVGANSWGLISQADDANSSAIFAKSQNGTAINAIGGSYGGYFQLSSTASTGTALFAIASTSGIAADIRGRMFLSSLAGGGNRMLMVDNTGLVTVSGAGTSGQWQTNGQSLYYNSSTVGVGTTAPGTTFQVAGTSNPGVFSVYNATTSSGIQGGIINMRSNSSSLYAPGALATGMSLGTFGFVGYDGVQFGAFGPTAEMRAMSTQAFAPGNNGTRLVFATTPNNSASSTDRLIIDHDGKILINTTSGPAMWSMNSGTSSGLYLTGAPPSQTGVAFIETYTSQTAALFVRANSSNSVALYAQANALNGAAVNITASNGATGATFDITGSGTGMSVQMQDVTSTATGISIQTISTNSGAYAIQTSGPGKAQFGYLSPGGAVYADNSGTLYVTTSGGAGGVIWTLSGSNITATNTNNNVGIGISSPSAKLHVSNNNPSIAALQIDANSSVTGFLFNYNGTSTGSIFNANSANAVALSINANNNNYNGALQVNNNASGPSIFATNGGNGPAAKFETNNNSPALSVQSNIGSTNGAASFMNFNTSVAGAVVNISNNSTFTGANGLSINMANATQTGLVINGRMANNGIASFNNPSATYPVAVDPSGTFYINTLLGSGGAFTVSGTNAGLNVSGNLSIGTTGTPKSKLQVNGEIGLGDGGNINNNAVVVYLFNSGPASSVGDIVVVGTSDDSFQRTTTASNNAAIGVLTENCNASSVCKVAVAGIVNVNIVGGATRGQHCVTSTTAGAASSVGVPNVGASIGVFLQTTAGSVARVLLR